MKETLPNIKPPEVNLEMIVKDYGNSMLRTAIALLRNKGVKNPETIGPDVVQQVYLRLLKNKAGLPDNKSELLRFLNWQINSYVDQYLKLEVESRANNPYRIRDSHLVPLNLEEFENNPEHSYQSQVEKHIDLENFRKFIMSQRNLSGLQKKIMTGIIIEGKSEKELAEELSYSVGHINVNKHRALVKLKQHQSFFDFLQLWAS